MSLNRNFLIFICLAALAVFAHPGHASDCVSALEDQAPMSVIHPLARRIFSRIERESVLTAAHIDLSTLPALFPRELQEHEMVKVAFRAITTAVGLSPYQRAVYWEELSAIIHRRIKQPIAQGYRGVHADRPAYIFQGRKRFRDGKVYVLIILENGGIFTGLHPPIENAADWQGRLEQLKYKESEP